MTAETTTATISQGTGSENQGPTSLTVRQFAERWAPGWTWSDWLSWPPDLFALSSAILRQSGAYRELLASHWPRSSRWQTDVECCATDWLNHVSDELLRSLGHAIDARPIARSGSRMEAAIDALESLGDVVTLERLRILEDDDQDARKLARELVALHAIADESCTGVGLLGSAGTQPPLVRCLANLLLVATGSLASLAKQHGIVLPKMRTPQSGLTVRSIAHQVTFHTTEVEIMWRTVPWANIHENTINMLLVPWPEEVKDECFTRGPDTLETVRYFSYAPPAHGDPSQLEGLVQLIVEQERRIGRVHIVVLPELALERKALRQLLILLRERHEICTGRDRLCHVPMVIAGVLTRAARGSDSDERAPSLNEVVLATYFAEKWYELSQRKHHRWKLERNQIRQYGLEGRLSTIRSWYEHIRLSQRRLTFLAPTSWLTLCPLICEDLAQLEPVSDLIRGVGPTLLTALLMDGPQLKERWSARYASVLADDPGTAVLTLSSIGMVRRSRKVGEVTASPASRAVGLWKDQPSGWCEISLPDGKDAMLLTISAGWTEEVTADGRGDHANASVFRYEGLEPCNVTPGQGRSHPNNEIAARLGDWADIRALTAATFVVDCLLETRGAYADVLMSWLLAKSCITSTEGRLPTILTLLTIGSKMPASVGVRATSRSWPTSELIEGAKIIGEWAARIAEFRDETGIEYLRKVAEDAERRLCELSIERPSKANMASDVASTTLSVDGAQRLRKAVALMILYALHTRLEPLRRGPFRMHGHAHATSAGENQQYEGSVRAAAELLAHIEVVLERDA